jgi:tetratricopeptide (TPR) repeat protein
MIKNFRGQNILVIVLAIASTLTFGFDAVAEKQKKKVSIKDPECTFVAPFPEAYDRLSKSQKLLVDEAVKLLEKRDLTKASEKLRELTRQTKDFAAEYDLGLIYAEQGDLEKAELALKRANEIYGEHRELYKILSKVQKALGKDIESKCNLGFYLQL